MGTRILEKASYNGYQGKPSTAIDTKVNACISAVEDIIKTFSRKDIETCNYCRRLIDLEN